jgi:hypothetical protein
MVKDVFTLSEEVYRKLYPTVSEILVDINKIVLQNEGFPEGLIDNFKPYTDASLRARAQLLFGYQFEDGGFFLKMKCRSVYMDEDPRQFLTEDGLLWRYDKVDFYVDSADIKYFGLNVILSPRTERVRQSVLSYFVNRGFFPRGENK